MTWTQEEIEALNLEELEEVTEGYWPGMVCEMKTITGEIRVFFIEFLHEHGESSRLTLNNAFNEFYSDMRQKKGKEELKLTEINKRFCSNINDLANRQGFIVPHETARNTTYTLSQNITKYNGNWIFKKEA